MTYKDLKNKIKVEQKVLALKIRNGKFGRKPHRRDGKNLADWNKLEVNQELYRHRHITYCTMFNNTPYELIEKPRDNNKPSSYYLDQIKKEWEGKLDEALRHSA